MRDSFEEEIRAEVEEEDEADLEDALTLKMAEFQEQKDYDADAIV